MFKGIMLSSVCVCLIGQTAKPFEVKGVTLGMKAKEFKAAFKIRELDHDKFGFHSTLNSSLVGIRCKVEVEFRDYGDGLVVDKFYVENLPLMNNSHPGNPSSTYWDLQAALVEKFGPASGHELPADRGLHAVWRNLGGDCLNLNRMPLLNKPGSEAVSLSGIFQDRRGREPIDQAEAQRKKLGDI